MRILVVEDERTLGMQIVGGLRDELHTADLVTDGLSALNAAPRLRDGLYDAVVLDVVLPGCDGLTVCRQWRASGLRVPILMLTARQTVDDRVSGLDAGADDYLTKPFAFVEFLARLRALGRREPSLHVGPLRAGDLTLGPLTRRVERAGRPIHLTAREYAIVELLLRHPGQVLTRYQIAAGAWELGAEHASNVVDVFIKNLRRKIDGPYARKLLHTVRGIGYTLHDQDTSSVPVATDASATTDAPPATP